MSRARVLADLLTSLNISGDVVVDNVTANTANVAGALTADTISTTGSITAPIVTANSFVGDGSGLTNAGATVAVKADNVDYNVTFTNQLSEAHANTFVDSNVNYNPSTQTLTSPKVDLNNLLVAGGTGSAGQVLTSNGANQTTWTTLSTGAGGATVTAMASDITLTSASNKLQIVVPDDWHRKIVLPDATTLDAGPNVFVIRNETLSEYPVKIETSDGKAVGWVTDLAPTYVDLINNSTATGKWFAYNDLPESKGGLWEYGINRQSSNDNRYDYQGWTGALTQNHAFQSSGSGSASVSGVIMATKPDGKAGQLNADSASSTQSTNNVWCVGKVNDTTAVLVWQDTSSNQLKMKQIATTSSGDTYNVHNSDNATYPYVLWMDTNKFLLIWSDTIGTDQVSIMYFEATSIDAFTLHDEITVTGTYNDHEGARLSSTLAHVRYGSNIKSVTLGATTLTDNGTHSTSPYSARSICRANTTHSIVAGSSSTNNISLFLVDDNSGSPTRNNSNIVHNVLAQDTFDVKLRSGSDGNAVMMAYTTSEGQGASQDANCYRIEANNTHAVPISQGVFRRTKNETSTNRRNNFESSNNYTVIFKAPPGTPTASYNWYQLHKYVIT